MSFSKEVWKESAPVLDSIFRHLFIQELSLGTLDKKRFQYYIQQDSLFLCEFSSCLALLASRCSPEHKATFLEYAQSSLIGERELVHFFYQEESDPVLFKKIMPANIAYTSYLKSVCALEPVEVGMAAVLPCFWIYQEVGQKISKEKKEPNIYDRWIETYSSDDFSKSTQKAISLIDCCAEETSEKNRLKMNQSFHIASYFEWHFWNDAYHLNTLDACGSPRNAITI